MKETMQDRFGEGGDLLCTDVGQGGRQGRGKQVTALNGREFCCGANTSAGLAGSNAEVTPACLPGAVPGA